LSSALSWNLPQNQRKTELKNTRCGELQQTFFAEFIAFPDKFLSNKKVNLTAKNFSSASNEIFGAKPIKKFSKKINFFQRGVFFAETPSFVVCKLSKTEQFL